MKHSCVMVDTAIDQGGCFETMGYNEDPTYVIDDIIRTVRNMLSRSRTSTISSKTATLPSSKN